MQRHTGPIWKHIFPSKKPDLEMNKASNVLKSCMHVIEFRLVPHVRWPCVVLAQLACSELYHGATAVAQCKIHWVKNVTNAHRYHTHMLKMPISTSVYQYSNLPLCIPIPYPVTHFMYQYWLTGPFPIVLCV